MDSGASEKFVSLLRVTLETLSQLLEVGTLNEAGRITEEILSYLRSTVTVEPTATVKCVQQVKEVNILYFILSDYWKLSKRVKAVVL